MPNIVTVKAGSRSATVDASLNGSILEFGPAATGNNVGVMTLQFNPDVSWSGTLLVLARVFGNASAAADIPFMPVPYRRVALNNVASDYALVSDGIPGAAIIQVPANGLSIAVLVACDTGVMTVAGWDMQGSGAV